MERANTHRGEKAEEHLKRVAAEFLAMESNRTALITVTRAEVSKDLKRATIFITVLPEERETQALEFARRRLADFRDYVKEKMKYRTLPFFAFEIDKGEKGRQRLDEISKK
ncbi:MAG: ribosome-binding factor A [bacterium]|nr:ribosome-binding factor A [bacterium]